MREDEVGGLDLQKILSALRAAMDAVSEPSAGANGNPGLNQVERLAGHMLFGIQERVEALALVILEHA